MYTTHSLTRKCNVYNKTGTRESLWYLDNLSYMSVLCCSVLSCPSLKDNEAVRLMRSDLLSCKFRKGVRVWKVEVSRHLLHHFNAVILYTYHCNMV